MVDCERANSLPFSPTWKVREVLKSGSLEEAGAGEEGGGGSCPARGGNLLLHRDGVGGGRLLLRVEHFDKYNYPPLTLSFSYCPAMAFLKGLGMMMMMAMALLSLHISTG
mgnify:CR=1 FL=1